MRILRGVFLVTLSVTTAACAAAPPPYQPKVDLGGSDPARYAADLRDCEKAADLDRFGPVLAGLVIGASFGAGLGTVAGWAINGDSGLVAAAYGAAAGGLAGTAFGASQVGPPTADAPAVNQCLRNNGYDVKS
jgi:hypothetical protein